MHSTSCCNSRSCWRCCSQVCCCLASLWLYGKPLLRLLFSQPATFPGSRKQPRGSTHLCGPRTFWFHYNTLKRWAARASSSRNQKVKATTPANSAVSVRQSSAGHSGLRLQPAIVVQGRRSESHQLGKQMEQVHVDVELMLDSSRTHVLHVDRMFNSCSTRGTYGLMTHASP